MADNIINKVRGKGIKINRINNKSKFIYINKIKDNTYKIRINVNSINMNIKNSKIYESKIIIK